MELAPYVLKQKHIGGIVDGWVESNYYPLNPSGRWMIETFPDQEGYHLLIEHEEFKFFGLIPWRVWIHEDLISFRPKKIREIYDCETKELYNEEEDTSYMY